MTSSKLYLENDHVVVLEALVDADDVPVTDAVVTVESVLDSDGDAVSGVTVPLNMPHDAGGTYKGLLPNTIVIVAGDLYTAVIKAVSGGLQAEWSETLVAKRRTA